MSQLTFADVMQQLASQSGTATPMTKERLFAEWWDSAAKKPGATTGPHCDDESVANPKTNLATRNGFPYRCPRPEANQPNPFAAPSSPDGYSAIAYSNRFDLASVDGSDCGEYRVVFARNSGKTNFANRNLIIFEARIPNPAPTPNATALTAHDGCRPILEFWLGLSNPAQTNVQRGGNLKTFFLSGIPGAKVGPIIHVENFSSSLGQIRTNQFMSQPTSSGFEWTLREFKAEKSLANGFRIVPVTNKTNPGSDLFFSSSTDSRVTAFVGDTLSGLDNLRGKGNEADILAFNFNNQDMFNSFDSIEGPSNAALGDVLERFQVQTGGPLRSAIATALAKAGSALTPENIVRRIRTQTCAGCHAYSNGDTGLGTLKAWPSSMGFVHQSEEDGKRESGPDGANSRFGISPALRDEFIPFRQNVMVDFLSKFPSVSSATNNRATKK